MGSCSSASDVVQFKQPLIVPFSGENKHLLRLRQQYNLYDLSSVKGQLKENLDGIMAQIARVSLSQAYQDVKDERLSFYDAKLKVVSNMLKNLIHFSKKIEYQPEVIKKLNSFLRQNYLPLQNQKYFVQESKSMGGRWISKIKATNNFDMMENDYIQNSEIKFKIQTDNNYNNFIMKVINYIIQLPEQEVPVWSYHSKKIAEGMESDESQREKTETYYKQFTNVMTSIFKEVFDYRIMVDDHENMEETQKKKYAKMVQEYTHYKIGRKIPQNVPMFSALEIQNKELRTKNPPILRLLVKWSEQLQKKFDADYLLNYPDSFYYIDKRKGFTEPKYKKMILIDLMAKQKNNVIEEGKEIEKQFDKHTAYILNDAKQMNTKELDELVYQEGFLCSHINSCTQVFLANYINSLIKGLTKMSTEYYENQKPRVSAPYNFVTLTIGDLFRCKIKSKQKQILHVYKILDNLSIENPKMIKIVRVKNRLQEGTKDILINFKFYNKIMAQIQLAIDSEPDKEKQLSYDFSHLVYELNRSKFGTISELASIWNYLNPQSSAIAKMIMKENEKKVEQAQKVYSHNKHNLMAIKNPFRCSECGRFYLEDRSIISNLACQIQGCHYTSCYECNLEKIPEDKLKKLLFGEVEGEEGKKEIVSYILGEDAANLKIGIAFNKLQGDRKILYFMITEDDSTKKKVIIIKSDDSETGQETLTIYNYDHANFLRRHLLFSSSSADNYFKSVNKETIQKQCILPNKFKEMERKERQVVLFEDETLTNNEVLSLIGLWSTDYQRTIKRINLSKNEIAGMAAILNLLKNLEELILDQNPITVIEFPRKARSLKNLSLAKNKKKDWFVNTDGFNYESLTYLNVGFSKQIGCIPKNIYLFTNLIELSAQDLTLKQFPEEILMLKNLRILALNKNKISEIPKKIGELKNLRDLQLKNNVIQSLPETIGQLKDLVKLRVQSNKIRFLPESISTLFNLQELLVEKNKLSALPPMIQNLTKLKILMLNQNGFSTLPEEILKLPLLEKIQMNKNQLTNLMNDFSPCQTIKHLSFKENDLIRVSGTLGELTNLIYLNLSSNKLNLFSFQKPKLFKLQKLYLQNNLLRSIDSSIFQASKLQELYLNGNKIMEVNPGIKQLKKLIKLTLDFEPLLPASKKIIKHIISYSHTQVYDKDQKITFEHQFEQLEESKQSSDIKMM